MVSTACSEASDGFFSCQSPHVWFNDEHTTVHFISPSMQATATFCKLPLSVPPPPPLPVQLAPRPPLELPSGRALMTRPREVRLTQQQDQQQGFRNTRMHVLTPRAPAHCVSDCSAACVFVAPAETS